MAAAAHKTHQPLATSIAIGERGHIWRVRVLDGYILVDRAERPGAPFTGLAHVTQQSEPVAAEGELRPEIAIGPAGQIYVAWTSPLPESYAGHVRFARSADGGRSFEAPITVNDNREAITHRFQTMHVAPNGRITLAWIDKRDLEAAKRSGKEYRGAAIYTAVSDDNGASFKPNARLAAHSCECCRIALASDTDGAPIAFWRHVFADGTRDHALLRIDAPNDDPARATTEQWKVNACPHHGPDLVVAADGTRHGAWFNQTEGEPGLFYGAWRPDGQPLGKAMRFGPPNAAHPALLLIGKEILLAWKAFDGERTVVSLMRSADGGRSWSEPHAVAAAEGGSDHPRLLSRSGEAYLSWSTEKEGYRLILLSTQGISK